MRESQIRIPRNAETQFNIDYVMTSEFTINMPIMQRATQRQYRMHHRCTGEDVYCFAQHRYLVRLFHCETKRSPGECNV